MQQLNTMRLSDIRPTYERREWLKRNLVHFIRANIEEGKLLEVKKGQYLLTEGGRNTSFYIVVRGSFKLIKNIQNHEPKVVDEVSEGDLVGIISYMSGEEIASSVVAHDTSYVISLQRAYNILREQLHEQFNDLVLQIVINSFVDRYRYLLDMHVEMEASKAKLVTQEKMAILGQLVAGVAPELNNPVAAMARSSDFAAHTIQSLLTHYSNKNKEWFDAGFSSSAENTASQRQRQKELEKKFKQFDRSVLRKISAWPDDLVDKIGKKEKRNDLQEKHEMFELGKAFRTMQITSDRIGAMVKSLKTYSRTNSADLEFVDVNDGIKDTILILGNLLKKRTLSLELEPVKTIRARTGELNQVWTNIIKNACEATTQDDKVRISSKMDGDDIVVFIEDSGNGVPEEMREKVFEVNVTTKHTEGEFGLGLGLPISMQIVEKYGGTLKVEDSEDLGGAKFIVRFNKADIG